MARVKVKVLVVPRPMQVDYPTTWARRFHNGGSLSGKLCGVPVHPEGDGVLGSFSRWVRCERKGSALGVVAERIAELTGSPSGSAFAHVVSL